MANWEHQLLTRIINTGDINPVLSWGITQQDFLTSEGRAMFQALVGYAQLPDTRGAVLGPHAVRNRFPTFELFEDVSMTTEALCLEVRKDRIRVEMQQVMMEAGQLMPGDPQAALERLQAGSNYLQMLGTSKRTDVYADEAMGRILQRYEMKEQGMDLSICPWPWQPLQEATGGLEPDDYVVIYGRPKSMKSWILAYLISWAYNHGKNILIYTKEMTADNIYMRVGAAMATIRYHEFRHGKLSPNEKAAIYEVWHVIQLLRSTQPMVCLSGKDAGDRGDTVPWLRSKVEQHKPDIVFIDGMYLMSDIRGYAKQKDNARVQNISRDLRQMVLDTRVPVVCTLQANREAAKHEDANLDEIAFSDAIGQDVTLAMRVINEKDQPRLILKVGGSREYELDGFCIYGIPATNFEYYGPLDAARIQKAIAQDVGESDETIQKQAKKAAAKPKAKKQEDDQDMKALNEALRDIMQDLNRS